MSRTVDSVLITITDRVNGDPALTRRGRYVNLTFQLGIDNDDYLITIKEGSVVGVELRHLSTETGVFSIRSSLAHWQQFWLPVPPRDYQDLFSMLPKQYAQLDGDVLPLMQNLQYFKDVLACGRQLPEDTVDA
jgi:hypothetical protein